jgi:hypothetical protein
MRIIRYELQILAGPSQLGKHPIMMHYEKYDYELMHYEIINCSMKIEGKKSKELGFTFLEHPESAV